MFNKKKIHRAYEEVFDTESTVVLTVLRDLCAAHGVFDGGFDPDPYKNAFSSGERNVILRILTLVHTKPEDIINLAIDKEGAY